MLTRSTFPRVLRKYSLLSAALVFSALASAQVAEVASHNVTETPVISLAPDAAHWQHATAAKSMISRGGAPANFHTFTAATAGNDSGVEPLTLSFSASTTLTKLESKTKDFVVEPGGTCAEGKSFSSGQSCTVLVRFNPQGAGNRTGKLQVGFGSGIHAKPQVMDIGLGGNGYAPVLSFTPAMITTVNGTYPSDAGLLSGAQSLSVDGNDTLYIADTGNNLVRYIDSSGTIRTLASGYTAPLGITTDTFGEVYFDLSGSNYLYEVYGYGPVVQITGSGTDTCPAATPCTLGSEALKSPGRLSTDGYNRLFFPDNHSGAAMVTAQPSSAKVIYLYNPFPYQNTPSASLGVDSSDNIYSLWSNGGTCSIVRQSLYDAENSNVNFTKVAGGHVCGFSGDGGQAGNAEIGTTIGDVVFDLAGNMYFSDTNNQRVRRIDHQTGQINTIAGTGSAGYTGDSGPSTSAKLSYPTGVAVDSQGQVYIISGTGSSSGGAQVIRKLGPYGAVSFANTTVGKVNGGSVTVTNTGNSSMQLISTEMHGSNPGDFTVNPYYTTCDLTPGAVLAAGQSCKINFTFKPTAPGAREGDFTLLNNSVSGLSNIRLLGTALPPPPAMSIITPASGASITAGAEFSFRVWVTSSSSPAPTGEVAFQLDGGTIDGSPVTLSGGQAVIVLTSSTTGTHTLKATYSGDSHYASTSVQENITIVSGSNIPGHIIQAPVVKPVRIKRLPEIKK